MSVALTHVMGLDSAMRVLNMVKNAIVVDRSQQKLQRMVAAVCCAKVRFFFTLRKVPILIKLSVL